MPHCSERNRRQRSVTLKRKFQARMRSAILIRDQKTSVNSKFLTFVLLVLPRVNSHAFF